MTVTGQRSALATENGQMGSCDSLRVDEHHIMNSVNCFKNQLEKLRINQMDFYSSLFTKMVERNIHVITQEQ